MINMHEMCSKIEAKALADSDVYIVCADGLESLFFPKMVKQARDRVVLCGISEQNQVSVANGIALQGKKVYCIMMNAFLLHRALDQVKMACYSNTDIKFIGLSTNIIAMEGGYSHISIDDIAILKTTPNLEIYDPYTTNEMDIVLQKSFATNTPMYISCVVESIDIFHKYSKVIGGFSKLLPGAKDFCVITSGDAVNFLCQGTLLEEIARQYKIPTLYTAYQISPFDKETCKKIIKKYKNIMTFEARGTGALSSLVAEIIATNSLKCKFMPVYFKNESFNVVGYKAYAVEKYFDFKVLPRIVQRFFDPLRLSIKKDKISIRGDAIRIRHKLLGVTYDSRKITPQTHKRKILGVIPFVD